MKRMSLGIVALLFLGALPAGALAADQPEGDTGKGTVRVKLNSPFAIPYKGGEAWDDHSFSPDGKLLEILNVDRAEELVFELKPQSPGFEPASIDVKPACWKLKKLSKQEASWRCELSVTFKKGKVQPVAPPPKVEPPEEDDIPPMPGVPPPPPPPPPEEDPLDE